MVREGHLSRHWHMAAADQPRIRDGLVGRATRAGRDQRRAVAGKTGDAVNPRGLNGLGEGHRRHYRMPFPGNAHSLLCPSAASACGSQNVISMAR